MKERNYLDEIEAQIRKYKKAKNAEAVVYYTQALKCVAVSSWETFKGAWCSDSWRKKYALDIKAQENDFKRYAWL